MTSTKINLLILPLLMSILLSTATKLKIGKTVDNIFYSLLSPIHTPIGLLRKATDRQTNFIKHLPELQLENKNLKSQKALLLSENEQLKQTLADSKTLFTQTSFKTVLPVRIIGAIGNNTVASSLPVDKVKVGQPLVANKVLLGVVSGIKGSVIIITPLESDRLTDIMVHTASGLKGQYRFQSNTPQITGIPNLSMVTLADYVFTEPGELIPGNLVIGKIKKIISAAQEPLQKAEIRLESTLAESPDNLIIILEP